MEEELHRCKCGGSPEIFTVFPVSKQKYQGLVKCPECGETIHGVQWHWNKDAAAEDAVEEWNKAMPEEEEYGE